MYIKLNIKIYQIILATMRNYAYYCTTQNSNNMKTEIKTSQEKPKLGTYVFGGQCIYDIVKVEPKKNK